MPADEARALFERAGVPWESWDNFDATPETRETAILRHALNELRGPAIVALAGVVAGTVASVWALYL